MKSRRFRVLATTVGLWMAHTIPGFAGQPQPPSRLEINPGQSVQGPGSAAVNQQLANNIAGQLRQSGQLRHYNVNIRVENNVVELTGQVVDQTQREEVLRIVQGVPGVDRVRDLLEIANAPAASGMDRASGGVVPATTQTVVPEPRPLLNSQEGGFAAPQPTPLPNEPLPIFRAPPPGAGGPGGAPPPMPPYAWPTYAPYNNYSRVAYPQLYPQQAFPFIGPFNPYPKVPLGWRAVQLKWQDGHWWYGRIACGHDWWRVRYW